MDLEEETVSIRRLPDEDLSVREVRISCPDATGLGVDLTRMLLDFGLRILKGDISTDGKFCFLIFKVQLSSGVPPRWQMLKSRLEGICPSGADEIRSLWRWRSMPKEQQPFLLQVASYDRQGMLHSLTHALWESDTTVFKASITTSPSGEVADLFWLYDNRNELPENHRALEICDRVKGVLGPDAECSISSAPPDSVSPGHTATSTLHRRACKDATSSSNLRNVVSRKKQSCSQRLLGSSAGSTGNGSDASLGSSACGLGSATASDAASALKDAYAERQAEVELTVDNETSPVYSMLTLRCQDRKGLLYDLFRALKDIDFRVAYGRIEVYEDGVCEVDLFVQDAECCRISDPELLAELSQRVRTAVALPVRIDIKDAYDSACTELTVTANIDSGGRGRPRVTFDVTQGLSVAGVGVFMADVYIERLDPTAQDEDQRAQEMHRFLIHMPNGQPIRSERERKAIYDMVKAHLMGTSSPLLEKNKELAAAAAGAPILPAPGYGGLRHQAARAAGGAPAAGQGGDTSLLHGLSHKWFG